MGAQVLLNIINAAANAFIIQQAVGSVINYFKNRGKNDTFTTPDNTDKLNKDNFDQQKNFANINRDFRGGAANNIRSTRGGVLSFLGDRSRRLDDAPDIVEDNQSVLSGVSTLGGFFPFLNTRQPEIENQRIVEAGFLGVRLEIDKINRNIDAIAKAMAESAFLEQKYRKDMIDAMRRDLVEKGKDRSGTRSERSIFNLITRQSEKAQTRAGKFTQDFAKAMLLSAGLEAANIFFPDFGGDEGGEEGGDPPPPAGSGDQPKVGDYYQSGTGRSKKYYVLEEDGSFRRTNVLPRSGKKYKKVDFDPVIENIKNNQNNNLDGKSGGGEETSETKDANTSASLNFDVEYQNKNKLNKIFNTETPIAMNIGGLEGGEKVTFIDMRKKINDSTQGGNANGADSELVDNIPEFDPSRSSIYEAFVSA